MSMLRITLLAVVFGLLSCGSSFAADPAPVTAKYIFLFIGDGMGANQRLSAEKAIGKPLAINHLKYSGTTTTFSANNKVTDSAAAGTALACGVKTNNGTLGLDPKGNKLTSLAVKAQQRGMKIGILSSAELNDATPGAFYGHTNSRRTYDILIADMAASGFDFFGGNVLRTEKLKADDAAAQLRKAGYNVIGNPAQLAESYTGKTYVFRKFSPAIDEKSSSVFTLAQLTATAIKSLDQEKGFFMMVEGGQIDWRGHANDAAGAVHETEQFDLAVREALAFAAKHPNECIIVVTADHETGGMKLLGQADPVLPKLLKQKGSLNKYIEAAATLVKENGNGQDFVNMTKNFFGWTDLPAEEAEILQQSWDNFLSSSDKLSGTPPPVAEAVQKFNAACGVTWTSRNHSGNPVVTTAEGVGAERFAGNYDNTELNRKLTELLPQATK